jgi:hypothetical protein
LRTRPREPTPREPGYEPAAFDDGLPGIAGSHRTYVGLREPAGWRLLVITSAATTPLLDTRDGGPAQGTGATRDEASSMAGALLEDLTGRRAPSYARAALARRIAGELEGATFALYSSDLDTWLEDADMAPDTWPADGRDRRSRLAVAS